MTAAAVASETFPALSEPFSVLADHPTPAIGYQLQLGPERQLTLDGRAEPLSAPAADAFHARADAAEPQDTYDAQASLFGWPQAALPFHTPRADGMPHADCLKGWKVKSDAHAVDDSVRVLPECCNRQKCSSSEKANSSERARDLWDGTSDDEGERIGLRHAVGEAELGVLVATLPPHLRPGGDALEVRQLVNVFARAVYENVCGYLRRHVRRDDAAFYVRSYVHPCGENAEQWKPHVNLMIPAWFFSPSEGRARHFKPFLDVAALRACVSAAQLEVFGDGSSPQCFWKYEQDEAGKRHQAKYVARVFPSFAHMKFRPATYGLSHPKNRDVLRAALDSLHMKALPKWTAFEIRPGLEPAPIVGHGATEVEGRAAHAEQLRRHRAFCEHCGGEPAAGYPEHRRTMRESGSLHPLEPPPPQLQPGPLAGMLRWYRQQLSTSV